MDDLCAADPGKSSRVEERQHGYCRLISVPILVTGTTPAQGPEKLTWGSVPMHNHDLASASVIVHHVVKLCLPLGLIPRIHAQICKTFVESVPIARLGRANGLPVTRLNKAIRLTRSGILC